MAVLAGMAALAVAPVAHAQNGFPDFRQAAADQYPAQPPPASASASENEQTGGSGGKARPVVGRKVGQRHHTSRLAPSNTNAAAPVAVSTRPVPAAKGSLPFTGSDLSGLVVLALALIAAGLFLAALARATRRRRRAPATDLGPHVCAMRTQAGPRRRRRAAVTAGRSPPRSIG